LLINVDERLKDFSQLGIVAIRNCSESCCHFV
jgi:hypothetical protein